MEIIVETSARHVHLSDEHLKILFGKEAKLTVKTNLSQPGQFASFQRVTVKGPKSYIENVMVLGPTRKETQVEISLTDARKLGIQVPIRESGDILGSPGCILVGPEGEIDLTTGVIAAKRHLHLTPKDAQAIGVKDKQIVSVKIPSKYRATIFGDVVCRVSSNFVAAMHIDTDEANAAGITAPVKGTVIL